MHMSSFSNWYGMLTEFQMCTWLDRRVPLRRKRQVLHEGERNFTEINLECDACCLRAGLCLHRPASRGMFFRTRS